MIIRRISREDFERLVHTKKWDKRWDAYFTWCCHDFFQLADTEQQAKDNLFRRINEGWEDTNPDNQERD